MKLGEVKQLLLETVKEYHPGTTVVWEKTRGVTPGPPYITLGYGGLNRTMFPLSDDEREHRYYQYSFRFEINLYTVGKEIMAGGAGTGAYENTAMEDLEEFIRFLDSEEITDRLAEKGVSIVFSPPVQDLSELIGSTRFSYRSMSEFVVTFNGTADGKFGVCGDGTAPNPSGGGTPGMREKAADILDGIEIMEDIGGAEKDE